MNNSNTIKPNKQQSFNKGWLSLAGLAIFLIMTGSYAWAAEPATVPEQMEIVVYKTATCGCCGKWIEHLEDNGFDVEVNVVSETNSTRSLFGVPREMASCHTATAGDHWVEGHVPADLIRKMLTEQPEGISGIAVPGMPLGSPGMESPNPSTYRVLSVDDNGDVQVYAVREGQKAH